MDVIFFPQRITRALPLLHEANIAHARTIHHNHSLVWLEADFPIVSIQNSFCLIVTSISNPAVVVRM